MVNRFVVPPQDRLSYWGFFFRAAIVATVYPALLQMFHPHPGVWWTWHIDWHSWWMTAVLLFLLVTLIGLFSMRKLIQSVEASPDRILLHRQLQSVPLLGRFVSPLSFPRPDWQMLSHPRGLLLGKRSADIEFQWDAERVHICPEAAKPALEQWLSSLVQNELTTDAR